MWKLKQSKYKNTTPKTPKKEEWIGEVNAANLMNSASTHIKVSASYIVYNTKNAGGCCLGILPLDIKGRQEASNMHNIDAHSEFVSDFDFSPHNDFLLATGSHDATVKLWSLPKHLTSNISDAVSTVCHTDRRVEMLSWNPLASGVLGVSAGNNITVHDVERQASMFEFSDHDDMVQSFGWKGDGSLMVSSCKDGLIRIIDPRSSSLAQSAVGHASTRDSRALWLGMLNQVVTTGCDLSRVREVTTRDVRNFSKILENISFDTSTSIFLPFFDSDTNMLYASGKGDTSIRFMEVTETDPYLVLNATDTMVQIKGLARAPKRVLDVMSGEVNRFYLLTKNAIIPISYCVPRKSYADFHSEIFPETYTGIPTMTCDDWRAGAINMPQKMSLNPSDNPTKLLHGDQPVSFVPYDEAAAPAASAPPPAAQPQKPKSSPPQHKKEVVAGTTPTEGSSGSTVQETHRAPSTPPMTTPSAASVQPQEVHQEAPVMRHKPVKAFVGVRQSKFRHLKGTILHKSLHFDNLRNLSKNMPGESDIFHANRKFLAVPLSGPGGLIAIIKTDSPGRLQDAGLPVIQNCHPTMDFVFDPFDDHRLVTGCDDARVRVWNIPEEGLTESVTEADVVLPGHEEKIYFVRFHPLAKDILASGSYDMTVRIWNLETENTEIILTGHTDTIFCLAWSRNGKYCATLCKDGKIRVYDPRSSTTPIQEGTGPEGHRGARLVWACEDRYLIATGFHAMGIRTVYVYNASDVTSPVHTHDLDASTAILMPHYDPDSSTLFLTGKGDSVMKTFEVSDDEPHLFPLSDYSPGSLHQAFSFLPKCAVDVKQVEFMRSYRLTNTLIEPVSFTVPRVKSELFQDDIFPETPVTWEPTMSAEQWLSGDNTPPRTISLRPDNMKLLSANQPRHSTPSKYMPYETYRDTHKTDEEKKEELLSAMTCKMDIKDEPLPQDLMEGANDDDWDD